MSACGGGEGGASSSSSSDPPVTAAAAAAAQLTAAAQPLFPMVYQAEFNRLLAAAQHTVEQQTGAGHQLLLLNQPVTTTAAAAAAPTSQAQLVAASTAAQIAAAASLQDQPSSSRPTLSIPGPPQLLNFPDQQSQMARYLQMPNTAAFQQDQPSTSQSRAFSKQDSPEVQILGGPSIIRMTPKRKYSKAGEGSSAQDHPSSSSAPSSAERKLSTSVDVERKISITKRPEGNASAHDIIEYLMQFVIVKTPEDREFAKKALESLVKKLKEKKEEMEGFIRAVDTNGIEVGPCVLVPRTLDGRLQVAGKKGFPHVTYAKLFRWLETNKTELKSLPDICKCGFDIKDNEDPQLQQVQQQAASDSWLQSLGFQQPPPGQKVAALPPAPAQKYVCVNPWHYQVVAVESYVPLTDANVNAIITKPSQKEKPDFELLLALQQEQQARRMQQQQQQPASIQPPSVPPPPPAVTQQSNAQILEALQRAQIQQQQQQQQPQSTAGSTLLTYTQPVAGMNPGLLMALQQQQQQQISPMLLQPQQQPAMTEAMLKTLAAMQPQQQQLQQPAAAVPQLSPAAAVAAAVVSPPAIRRMQENLETMMVGAADPSFRAQLQQQHGELMRLQHAQQPAAAAAAPDQLPLPDVIERAVRAQQEAAAAAAEADAVSRALVRDARERGVPLAFENQMAWEAELDYRDPLMLNAWKLEERRLISLKPPRFMPLMESDDLQAWYADYADRIKDAAKMKPVDWFDPAITAPVPDDDDQLGYLARYFPERARRSPAAAALQLQRQQLLGGFPLAVTGVARPGQPGSNGDGRSSNGHQTNGDHDDGESPAKKARLEEEEEVEAPRAASTPIDVVTMEEDASSSSVSQASSLAVSLSYSAGGHFGQQLQLDPQLQQGLQQQQQPQPDDQSLAVERQGSTSPQL